MRRWYVTYKYNTMGDVLQSDKHQHDIQENNDDGLFHLESFIESRPKYQKCVVLTGLWEISEE